MDSGGFSVESGDIFQGVDFKKLTCGQAQVFEFNAENIDCGCEDYEDAPKSDDDRDEDGLNLDDKLIAKIDQPFSVLAEDMFNVDPKGLVKKLVLKEGNGLRVSPNDQIYVHYNLYFDNESSPFDSTQLRGEQCFISEGNVIEGLVIAVQSMCLMERSRFLFHWSVAFKKLGCPPLVPAEANILADIIVTKIVPSAIDEHFFCDSIVLPFQKALVLREEAKLDFKQNKLKSCESKYYQALEILKNIVPKEKESEYKKEKLAYTIYINLAVVYNKLNKPEKSLSFCQKVLKSEPEHPKAIFQCGRAYFLMNKIDKALAEIMKGRKLFPKCQEFQNELKKLDDLKREMEKDSIMANIAFR